MKYSSEKIDAMSEIYFNHPIWSILNDEMRINSINKLKSCFGWILDEVKGIRILDVGCNIGSLSFTLVSAKHIVTGIDISPDSIQRANSYLNAKYSSFKGDIKFKQADFLNYQTSEKFDSIVIMKLLSHVRNPEDIVKHASKLLNPGGKIIVTIFFGRDQDLDRFSSHYISRLLVELKKYFKSINVSLSDGWVGISAQEPNLILHDVNITYEDLKFIESAYTGLLKEADSLIKESENEAVRAETKLKEETLQLKEETSQLKEETTQLKEETIQLKEEATRLKEETTQLKEEASRLKEETTKSFDEKRDLLNQLKDLEDSQSDLNRNLSLQKVTNVKIQNELHATRSSVSFRLGYTMAHSVTSLKCFFRLPLDIGKIVMQGLNTMKSLRQGESSKHSLIEASKSETLIIRDLPLYEEPKARDFPSHLLKTNKTTNTKVACVMDDFTYASYKEECDLNQLTPGNWELELNSIKPELLFIESAWRGKDQLWGSKIGHNSEELQGIINWCNSHQVPTMFWNKEDPIHFQTFLNTAKQFDYVFTTDIDCIHRYKAALKHQKVYFLPFACQPVIQNPIEKYVRKDAISFAGAYYVKYPERAKNLESLISALPSYKRVDIFDRNLGKTDVNYMFPKEYKSYIVGTLPFEKIDISYKGYKYAINLNSINQSQSMFARRVYELLSSNTLTISNFSRGVRLMFGDLVVATDSGLEAVEQLKAIEKSSYDNQKLRLAGLRKVLGEHTYAHRFDYIGKKIFNRSLELPSEARVLVVAEIENISQANQIIESFQNQSHINKQLILISGHKLDVKVENDIELISRTEVKSNWSDYKKTCDWIACFSSNDFYGHNYLLDCVLSSLYCSASVIGKGAFFTDVNGKVELVNQEFTYAEHKNLHYRCSIAKISDLEDGFVDKLLNNIDLGSFDLDNHLSIDPFNYGLNFVSDALGSEAIELVSDIIDLDTGTNLEALNKQAESIEPDEYESSQDNKVKVSHIEARELYELFGDHKSGNVELAIIENSFIINSTLDNGKHEYIYSKELKPKSFFNFKDGRMNTYFDTTPGLSLSVVFIFFDRNEKRIHHDFVYSNKNTILNWPQGSEFVKMGLRILSSGSANIKTFYLEFKNTDPVKIFGKSETLILANNYPSYNDLYRNAFVHSRVKSYKNSGHSIDVFRLKKDSLLSFHEFESVDVVTGNRIALDNIIRFGNYSKILIHFLDEEMWSVLDKYKNDIDIIVWIHGAEIQPWWRRKSNFRTEAQLNLGKVLSESRIRFWRNLLNNIPKRLHLVFVSEYLASETFKDLELRIPKDQFSIISNPIDTGIFEYVNKDVALRKKILSIRPFRSDLYANDLTVKTILKLSTELFFNDLSFHIIGDGPLFDETVEPIVKFDNVKLEKRFISQREISALHKDYGVFLCPSRMDTQGVSRDEAMASGLVPVTNAVAAIPEFVNASCGFLAPKEDVDALAEAITTLYAKPDLFVKMSLNSCLEIVKTRSTIINTEKELSLIFRDR